MIITDRKTRDAEQTTKQDFSIFWYYLKATGGRSSQFLCVIGLNWPSDDDDRQTWNSSTFISHIRILVFDRNRLYGCWSSHLIHGWAH